MHAMRHGLQQRSSQSHHAGKARKGRRSCPAPRAESDGEDRGPRLNVADPAGTIVYGGTLPSGRRAAVGGLAAVGIVLGGNLGGVTSRLLALDGGRLAGQLRLDVLIPVSGFKRCVDYGYGFEFVYPAEWLADQTLLQRAAQRAEQERGLDLPALRSARARRRSVVEPAVAFGPPGSSGEENVSVIAAPIFEGFQLRSMGGPEAGAQRFLDTTVAPPGSDKTAALVAARSRRAPDGQLYYSWEFTVTSPAFNRHNISVLTSANNLLYTINIQCPEARWREDGARLQASADSFKLIQQAGGSFPAGL